MMRRDAVTLQRSAVCGRRVACILRPALCRVEAATAVTLHAEQFGFTHPNEDRWLDWEAPPPQAYLDLRGALAATRSEEPRKERR
jgi:hypothetical protein